MLSGFVGLRALRATWVAPPAGAHRCRVAGAAGHAALRVMLVGLLAAPSPAAALASCDRLVDGGVRDCNLRLGLDTYELIDQEVVRLTPQQLELARRQRPLHELAPTPEQFGQIQAYCRGHGEVRRNIGIARGLCEDAPAQ